MNEFPSPQQCDQLASPQLVVFPDAVTQNLSTMISMVSGEAPCSHLRPHLKTHKMQWLTQKQVELGITDFKAATIDEAKMAAVAGAESVLLAHQPTGAKIKQVFDLLAQHERCHFSVIIDSLDVCQSLAAEANRRSRPLDVLIDVDPGMHRTGVCFGQPLGEMLKGIQESKDWLRMNGLHVYDGHLHQSRLDERLAGVNEIAGLLLPFLQANRMENVVVGGTPTFQLWEEVAKSHSELTHWQFSPGTCSLWDWGYGEAYSEMPFQVAAAVLTRVISKPAGCSVPDRQHICTDLGYKAIASEMPLEHRVRIVGIPEAIPVAHSEEHLVLSVSNERDLSIGAPLWALPKHICPTVARYDAAYGYDSSGEPGQWHSIAAGRR